VERKPAKPCRVPITCPECERILVVPTGLIGQERPCPGCGADIYIHEGLADNDRLPRTCRACGWTGPPVAGVCERCAQDPDGPAEVDWRVGLPMAVVWGGPHDRRLFETRIRLDGGCLRIDLQNARPVADVDEGGLGVGGSIGRALGRTLLGGPGGALIGTIVGAGLSAFVKDSLRARHASDLARMVDEEGEVAVPCREMRDFGRGPGFIRFRWHEVTCHLAPAIAPELAARRANEVLDAIRYVRRRLS
jgi:hypothetical protein